MAVVLDGGIAVARIMPTIQTAKGRKKARRIDQPELGRFWAGFSFPIFVYVEIQQAYSEDGKGALFQTGTGYGMILQALSDSQVMAGRAVAFEEVRSQEWKGHFGIPSKEQGGEGRAAEVCQRLFPKVNLLASKRCRKPHSGMVDALLIAEYARRVVGRGEVAP